MSDAERPPSNELVLSAKRRGALSDASAAALNDPAVVAQIERGLDESYSVNNPGPITLVTIVPDDSRSIFTDDDNIVRAWSQKAETIAEGHNELLSDMLGTLEGRRTMLHTRYLNGTVLNPFTPLALCRKMGRDNYPSDPRGTPLYRETLAALGVVLAKTEELRERGALVTTGTLLMTDGQATDHSYDSERKLASVVRDMREAGHYIAGMGIGNPTEFQATFERMAIDPDNIYTARNLKDILEKFRMFRKEVRMLAQGTSTGLEKV